MKSKKDKLHKILADVIDWISESEGVEPGQEKSIAEDFVGADFIEDIWEEGVEWGDSQVSFDEDLLELVEGLAKGLGRTPIQLMQDLVYRTGKKDKIEINGKELDFSNLSPPEPPTLDFGILHSEVFLERQAYRRAYRFMEMMKEEGINSGFFGTNPHMDYEYVKVDRFPKLTLIYRLPNQLDFEYLHFLQEKSKVVNSPRAISYGNRYYLWNYINSCRDINIPETRFFDDPKEVEAFVQHSDSPLAIKEYTHRGKGTTVVKAESTDKLPDVLRRFLTRFPIIVQEWLPHNPLEDYMRVVCVGGKFMGSEVDEASDSIVHGQQATSFSPCEVPRSIQKTGRKVMEMIGAEWATFDFVRSEGVWYMVDLHTSASDMFDQFELTPEPFVDGWKKMVKEVM